MAKKKSKKTTSSLYGNYNDFITSRFDAAEITLGDRISFEQGDKRMEGNLMAQTDLGDPNSIQIKMDNGYNIGITVDESLVLKKLEGRVDLESFQIHVPEQRKGLPEISLLGTGGTIASRIDYQTGGVVMAMEPEEIFATLPELFKEISFKEVKSLFTSASEDLASKEWKIMAKNAAEAINNGIDGVVLLHGTDTMGYSAAALSFMLPKVSRPVVFTGAQRSSDRGSFDGAFNLISAARIAGKSNIASVMVCMHESSNDDYCQVSRGTKVRKMHTTRRDAFQVINDTPMARIDNEGKITELQQDLSQSRDAAIDPMLGYDDKVALIRIFPGIKPDLIDFYIDKGYNGLIIEGTGLGHVSTFPSSNENNFMNGIKRALSEDIFVGMTSQCLNGRVHPFVYRATRIGFTAGMTYLQDMLPETALVKLGWVLGNYDSDKIQEIMLTNLAGEISDRSYFKEFEYK